MCRRCDTNQARADHHRRMAEIDLPGLRTAHLVQVRIREAEILSCATATHRTAAA